MTKKKLVVLLTTRVQQKSSTQTITEWSGIFVPVLITDFYVK